MRDYMVGITQLFLHGMFVEMGYYRVIDLSDGYEKRMQNEWEMRFQYVQRKMLATDRYITEIWKTQASVDLDEFAKENADLPNKEYADKLFAFMYSKYYWRLWIIIVFDTEEPEKKNKHWVDAALFYFSLVGNQTITKTANPQRIVVAASAENEIAESLR